MLLTALGARTAVAPAEHEELRNIQSIKHLHTIITECSLSVRTQPVHTYPFVANVPLHSNINIVRPVVKLKRAIEL